jgi:hypothetical protein
MVSLARLVRIRVIALAITGLWWGDVTNAQQIPPDIKQPDIKQPDIKQIADMMVRLCVAGGQIQVLMVRGAGGVDLSLRSFDAEGKLQGQFGISRLSSEGLSEGLNHATSQIEADQADKVRTCLQPARERLLELMLQQVRQGSMSQQVRQGSTSQPVEASLRCTDPRDVGPGVWDDHKKICTFPHPAVAMQANKGTFLVPLHFNDDGPTAVEFCSRAGFSRLLEHPQGANVGDPLTIHADVSDHRERGMLWGFEKITCAD